ncbi:MBL fold metallo-hydrolase [Arthrobacter sp. H5]|uniref:MBL fold metallo-hydrolase n=1 Tax=Arthrobacter sp. H5 TaxID=1267973 RepID=UPI000484F864|nr:MBL fold metallo-hydrolase [Arthrobacter sp. H5]
MASDHEPTLTFFNGTTTIGGVQAAVQTENSALFFDFGTTPNPTGSLFSRSSPAPADGNLVAQLRAGMAPLVDGLYDPAQLASTGGSVASAVEPMTRPGRLLDETSILERPEAMGIFVSHNHNDHCALLPFVNSDVPVFMSSDGAALHTGLTDVGVLPPTPATVRGLDEGEHITIGDMDLELVHVDHDVPGAAGFVLQAGDRRIAWTGDWRGHGHSPERMAAFVERAAGVDLLITEGTTLRPDSSPTRPLSETEIAERVDRILGTTDGLAFVTPYPRNLRRLASLRDAAVANGRTLVLRPETLAGWRAAVHHGLSSPRPNDDGATVAVLATGNSIDRIAADETQVTIDDLHRNRNSFLVELQVPDRWVALATGAGPGDVLIHTNGEPLGAWAPEWTSLQAWVATLGLDFVWLDSGGHASPDDLAWLVDAVSPGAVAAVHSAHPHLFPRSSTRLILPARGQSFQLSQPGPHALGARGADSERTMIPCVSL